MKKILITGANSYIGTSFEKYMAQWPDMYQVDTVDMVDGTWRNMSFSGYDTIYHVAGIAHIKETKENAHLYYEINRNLPIEVAKKAKVEYVKQFIFLSSMSVFGVETGIITKDTVPTPKTNYGKSKLQAEEGLKELENESFEIVVIRPPMVYGKGCKGNYQRLRSFALKYPIFPYYKNERSMLYIGNLCEFVKRLIDNHSSGLFLPQNKEYVCTSDMVIQIAISNGKKIATPHIFGKLIKINRANIVQKVFGTLKYEKVDTVEKYNFIESIRLTEEK